MVFAIENLIKFKVANFKCTEIPITLHRDGRKNTKSHLKTFSDGWSTLRFLIVACPKWLFFIPSFLILIWWKILSEKGQGSIYENYTKALSAISFLPIAVADNYFDDTIDKYIDLSPIENLGSQMGKIAISILESVCE